MLVKLKVRGTCQHYVFLRVIFVTQSQSSSLLDCLRSWTVTMLDCHADVPSSIPGLREIFVHTFMCPWHSQGRVFWLWVCLFLRRLYSATMRVATATMRVATATTCVACAKKLFLGFLLFFFLSLNDTKILSRNHW